jgi:hypothetical protein
VHNSGNILLFSGFYPRASGVSLAANVELPTKTVVPNGGHHR